MKVMLRDDVSSTWLRHGCAYTVLSVEWSRPDFKLRLWADLQETCALFPVSDFSLVDARLSKFWLVDRSVWSLGEVDLCPLEWQSAGFWDRYYDDDPEAVLTFRQCMEKILSE